MCLDGCLMCIVLRLKVCMVCEAPSCLMMFRAFKAVSMSSMVFNGVMPGVFSNVGLLYCFQ